MKQTTAATKGYRFMLKFRKTSGSLLMVLAFVLQWIYTEYVEPARQSAFSSSAAAISEVREINLEVLFHQTHDTTYLSEALNTAAYRFAEHNWSSAFADTTREARFAPIVAAQEAKPLTWEAYKIEKQKLYSAMGRIWKTEWLKGARSISRRASALKISIFVISIVGLLLVWSGEAFGKKEA